MSTSLQFPSPQQIEQILAAEPLFSGRIQRLSQFIVTFLEVAKYPDGIIQIKRITSDPFDEPLVLHFLKNLYQDVFSIYTRLQKKTGGRVAFHQVKVGEKTVQDIMIAAVFQVIRNYEKQLFFAPVSARLDRQKGDYGPAMYSEVVKRTGENLIYKVKAQTKELIPTVSRICRMFNGVAAEFVSRGNRHKSDREKYEDIWVIFQAEQRVREHIQELGTLEKSKMPFVEKLVEEFTRLKLSYQEKIESFDFLQEKYQKDIDGLGTENADLHRKREYQERIRTYEKRKTTLRHGLEKAHEVGKYLETLRGLMEKFPKIERGIGNFVESDYQARSVQRFLEEINDEIKDIFGRQKIEAFKIIAALTFKLKGTSILYESANYYLAVSKMEEDLVRYQKDRISGADEEQKKIIAIEQELLHRVKNFHQYMLSLKDANDRIHSALLTYRNAVNQYDEDTPKSTKEKDDVAFSQSLQQALKFIENIFQKKVLPLYQECQKLFQQFSENTIEEKHIGEQVIRAFMSLSKSGQSTPMTKQDVVTFQRYKLYQKMKPHPDVREYYSRALRAFMKGEHSKAMFPDEISGTFAEELAAYKEALKKRSVGKKDQSESGLVFSFLAEQISPKEVEDFSRFVPCMPGNELRLTYPPGKYFLEVAEKHQDFLMAESRKQFILLGPGQKKKFDNEVTYRELSTLEVVKKAYKTMRLYMDSCFEVIGEEKFKEFDFIRRERLKWARELDQVIQRLQYHIDQQKGETLHDEGDFRVFDDGEKDLMMKHLSAEQIDQIEKQFGREHQLEKDSELFEVECLLSEIVTGFLQKLEQDVPRKEVFEAEQEEKRRLHLGGSMEQIEKKQVELEKLKWQKQVDTYLYYWEYHLNPILPPSARKLVKEVKIRRPGREEQRKLLRYITPLQLNRIRENLNLIRQHAPEDQEQMLLRRGEPLLKTCLSCFEILAKDEKQLSPFEQGCLPAALILRGENGFKNDLENYFSQAENKKK